MYKAFEHRGRCSKSAFKLQIVPRKTTGDCCKSFEFVALSSKELSVWRSDSSNIIRKPNKNVHGMHVLRAVCFHVIAGVHLLASIDKDMSMMILNASLDVIGTVPMGQNIVQDMAYISQTEEVLTGGSMGLRTFRLSAQPSRNGRTKRWILQLTRVYTCPPWVSSLRYHEHTNTAVVIWPQAQCVDIFHISDSKRLARLAGNLHDHQITDAISFPRSYYFTTSCLGGSIKIWYREHENVEIDCEQYPLNKDLSLSHLHTFSGHRRGVTRLDLHPSQTALFLSVSLDGSLRLWNAEQLVLVRVFENSIGRPLIELAVVGNGEFIVIATDCGTVIGYTQTRGNNHRECQTRLPDNDLFYEENDLSDLARIADPNNMLTCSKLFHFKSMCTETLASAPIAKKSGSNFIDTSDNHQSGNLLYPETSSFSKGLFETLVDARARCLRASGRSLRAIAALFVKAVLVRCTERLRCPYVPNTAPICTLVHSPALLVAQRPFKDVTPRGNPAGRQRDHRAITRPCNKAHALGFRTQPAATADPRLKTNLAPYIFLQKAMCRQKIWKPAASLAQGDGPRASEAHISPRDKNRSLKDTTLDAPDAGRYVRRMKITQRGAHQAL